MAEAAVTFLMENVTQLLKSYADLIPGAETELQRLENDLRSLEDFLREPVKKPKKEGPFRVMERQIREVVYAAEDTIDACLTQAAVAKGKNLNLAKEVKFLRLNKVKPILDRVTVDFAQMQIGDAAEQVPLTNMKKAPSIVDYNAEVFKDEEEVLIRYLMTEVPDMLDVISIIGAPGIGKTTLTRKIYQCPKIQYEFPTRIWVNVSQDFNRKVVFLDIMKTFTNEDMSNFSELELALNVHEILKKAKFLLVLDDVWTTEAWNEIRNALPKSNSLGKVLITSREKKVGLRANPTREPHMLRFLTVEESWQLLQFKVFGRLNFFPPELEEIGQYIARQCDGLPHAVVIIGGILFNQLSTPRPISVIKEAWTKVAVNVSGHIKDNKGGNVLEMIEMSYNNLRDELRDCFIYLGVFPQDYEIPAWTLTRLWIAEGFIQRQEGQSLEEDAEDILNEFINRNLVIVDKTNSIGKVKTCRIHYEIREFCIAKVAIEQQNLFQEIKTEDKDKNFYPPISDIRKYRRLSVHSDVMRFISSEPYGPQVRTFLHFSKEETILPPKNSSFIPDGFELLRVLDVKSIRFTRFPFFLTQPVHLRYIVLTSNFKVLPEVLSNMRNIQTLVVDTTSNKLEMKADITKMVQLRHVKTNASIILCERGSKSNKGNNNLQTLAYISPQSCTDELFESACNLKILGVRGHLATLMNGDGGSSPFDSLGNLSNLKQLKLVNDVYHSPHSNGQLFGLPPSHKFPPKLTSLTLSGTFLEWRHMSVLEMLKNLRILKLKNNAFVGKFWGETDGCFCQLNVLQVEYTNLVYWEASKDQFPVLEYLVLRNCEELRKLPSGFTSRLQLIDLYRTSMAAVASARKIQLEIQRRELKRGIKLFVFPPDPE